MAAGTGTVTVSGVIGGSATLTSLSLTGNGGVILSGIGGAAAGVFGSTTITSSTGITLNGGTYNAYAQTYAGPVTLGANTTVTSNNAALDFTGAINGVFSLSATADPGTVTVSGVMPHHSP